MRVQFFFVFEFTPESKRTKPLGAWIVTEDGGVDYVFSADYPDDEQLASDTVNRLIEAKVGAVGVDFLEYWQTRLGYHRSASEIQTHEADTYPEIFAALRNACL